MITEKVKIDIGYTDEIDPKNPPKLSKEKIEFFVKFMRRFGKTFKKEKE